jgi:hypothetical protein
MSKGQGYGDYEIDPVVLIQARRLGLIGNVEKRVARMAKFAAPFTHPEGNRRFESFILRIEKGVVKSIRKLNVFSGEIEYDVLGRLEERVAQRRKTLQAIANEFERPEPDRVQAILDKTRQARKDRVRKRRPPKK